MSALRSIIIIIVVMSVLSASGCTELSDISNPAGNPAGEAGRLSVAENQRTLAQPEDTARMVKMETDIYTVGDVVGFVITNEKDGDLSCSRDPPGFTVRYQRSTGVWVVRMGDENSPPGNATSLKPGESTPPYRFVTDGWAPGRYRIVTDCGVSREILLRALPSATMSGPSCPAVNETTPFIRVDPVSDQVIGDRFSITGTTNLAAGEELRYSIFAILPATTNISSAKLVSSTTVVSAGSCGTNTWYVEGVINIPGEYFIGISASENTVSAVKRFTVLEKARPTETTTLPGRSGTPGITTGNSG